MERRSGSRSAQDCRDQAERLRGLAAKAKGPAGLPGTSVGVGHDRRSDRNAPPRSLALSMAEKIDRAETGGYRTPPGKLP